MTIIRILEESAWVDMGRTAIELQGSHLLVKEPLIFFIDFVIAKEKLGMNTIICCSRVICTCEMKARIEVSGTVDYRRIGCIFVLRSDVQSTSGIDCTTADSEADHI